MSNSSLQSISFQYENTSNATGSVLERHILMVFREDSAWFSCHKGIIAPALREPFLCGKGYIQSGCDGPYGGHATPILSLLLRKYEVGHPPRHIHWCDRRHNMRRLSMRGLPEAF